MGIIGDILEALDKIPVWKRLQNVPAEVDDLRKRVAELEGKLSGKYPPDVCKFCGARAARMAAAWPASPKGLIRQDWKCDECGKVEMRSVKP